MFKYKVDLFSLVDRHSATKQIQAYMLILSPDDPDYSLALLGRMSTVKVFYAPKKQSVEIMGTRYHVIFLQITCGDIN